MRRPPQQTRVSYFGKIPACADFIKAADNLALVGLLDQWLAEVMNLLTAEPRWKQHYDALRPLHFAFVGTRSKRAIAGHLIASADQSQRRFPFMMMSVLDIAQPQAFVPRAPLVLASLWSELEQMGAAVLAAGDPAPPLRALAGAVIELDPEAAAHQRAFADFLDGASMASLDAQLDGVSLRRAMLALGLLLRPVRRSGVLQLSKSLALPLPRAPGQRYLVAAFWLELIAPFVQQADFELALFCLETQGAHALVVGFGGAAPETLLAMIDPQRAGQQVGFGQTGWVEALAAAEPAVLKLAACLEQERLSLRSAHALFHETFL